MPSASTIKRQVAAAVYPLGCRFPSDYGAFLLEHDGLEHDGGGAFVVLYPLADVVEWSLDRRGWLPNVVQVGVSARTRLWSTT